MSKLESTAREIAYSAHAGQFRRDGTTPYVRHPEAVAGRVEDNERIKAAAWLHDVLEDTSETADSLRERGIPEDVIEAIELMTHDKDIPYLEYVAGIANHPIASRVKLADILSNLSDNPTTKQIRKYARALLVLVPEGNEQAG